MSYAIVQRELNPPDVEAIKRSLVSLERFTAYDAWPIARDAFGVLVPRLTLEEAEQLQGAMLSAGMDVVMVHEDDLFPLPDYRRCRQADPFADGLTLYDTLDRPTTFAWEHVMVIAIGEVTTTKLRIQPSSSGAWSQGSVNPYGPDAGGAYVETTITEEHLKDLRLEVIMDTDPMRTAFEPFGTRYTWLGPRMTQSARTNFIMMCRDMMEHARNAMLNQGAMMLAQTDGHTFSYPTLQAFEEEIVWRIWKAQQP